MKQTLKKGDRVPFAQIAHSVLYDSRLTWESKGLFGYLYSKPEGYDFAYDRIQKDGIGGKRVVLRCLKELEFRGYLTRKKLGTGKIEYSIQYDPSAQNAHQGTEPSAQNSNLQKQQLAETSTISNKENISNTENTSNTDTAAFEKKVNFWIGELFDRFKKTVNPKINFGHTSMRKAARDLVVDLGFYQNGEGEVCRAVKAAEFACAVQGERFAPVIVNPYQLQAKMPELRVFYERSKNGNGKGKEILGL